ncbi:hypothetical protein GGI05_007440, partial [Coemansia sp. RSA 2603]
MDSYKTPIRISPGVTIPASVPRPASTPFVTPSSLPRDYRLSSSASKADMQSQTQLPSLESESFSRGKWINPEAQRVLDDRATHLSESQSTMRLRWNVLSIFAILFLLQSGLYRQIK